MRPENIGTSSGSAPVHESFGAASTSRGRDLLVRRVVSDVPTPDDFRDYATLQNFARVIDAPVTMDYWKSIPYFASFMEGYQPENARVKIENDVATSGTLMPRQAPIIDTQVVRKYEQLEYANARLHAFAQRTIEKD